MKKIKIPSEVPICIKSHSKDLVTEAFAIGCGGIALEQKDFYLIDFKKNSSPIVVRGINTLFNVKKYLKKRKKSADYYFIDTGYIGNRVKKIYHRVTKNALQVSSISERPNDRSNNLENFQLKPWKYNGKKILICPPSYKSFKFFSSFIDKSLIKNGQTEDEALNLWLENAIEEIRRFSDREIVIREKPRGRLDRVTFNTFEEHVLDDIFATVTFNSIVAVESIANGVPAFVCAENAASPVCLNDLSKIETPAYPKRIKWINHLSYSQFTVQELFNGTAWRIINNIETKKQQRRRIKNKKTDGDDFKKWSKVMKKKLKHEEDQAIKYENENFLKSLSDDQEKYAIF